MLTRVHLIFKALHSCSPFFYSGQDTVYLRDNFPHLIFISKSNWHINQICIISAHFGKPVLKYSSRTTFLPLSLDDHIVILSHTFINFFLNWDHLKPWEFYQLNGEQSVLLLTWMLFMQLSVIPFYWQMFDKCSMQKCQFLHQVFDTVCRNSAWPKIYMNKSKVQESK